MAGGRQDTMAGADIAREPLFMTQRRRMIESYKAAGEPFSASTKPYKSTVTYTFTVVNPITASSVAWAIALQGQAVDYFGYKIGDTVPGNSAANSPGYRTALESDTNLSKARTTNGAEDFVIEGMSATHSSSRLNFATGLGVSPSNISDATVSEVIAGSVPLIDPASLYAPPQVYSPFNLEDAPYRALAPNISLEFQWDRGKIVKIGTLEQIPEGAANSYLRSSGEPSTNDRYRIPEGYLWRREGQPDSEFIVRGVLTQAVAMPILTVLGPSETTPFAIRPGFIMLDCAMRLHGLSVKLPTRN